MNLNFLKNPKKIELHYSFVDDSHTMDAFIRNNCERELLSIVKEITYILDIDVNIETEAYIEGGLKELWSIASNNKFVIGVITGILVNVLSTYLTKDNELTELQKEELRLKIQVLKKELEESNEEKPIIIGNDIYEIFNKNLKIIKHKSNFYKNIHSYQKVTKVTSVILTDNNEPLIPPHTVERKDFEKFILKTDELPPFIDENATLEILSPVLKKGKYKWKGIYNGEVISFSMRDKDFKFQVINSKVQFKNGTTIDCVLEISRKINDIGEIYNSGYAVLTVLRIRDENAVEDTPQGKKYLMKKQAKRNQLNLFDNNDNKNDN